ncbi:MAG: hypothetical protein IT562_24265 [Alphaproteobacteria bacterium]|nr:hypothetical protein [Alphaproteobacteria bacterium]
MTDDAEIGKLLHLLRPLPDDERRLGLLKRIAADGGKLPPRWAPSEPQGYVYWPGVARDLRELFASDLAYLADRDYLRRGHFDRLNRCPACRSANLNIREVCPSCGSTNLFSQPMLHHYRCGYVGAIGSFASEGEARICPKCDGALRHLGTDHEVVGEQFGCRRCFASFEEPGVEALCMGCGARTAADKLAFDDVFEFGITNLGHAALRSGRLFDRDDEQMTEPDLPLYRRQVALALLRDEVRRQARYRIPFSVLVIRTRKPGEPAEAERAVILQVRDRLRDVDHLGRYGDDAVIAMLPATPEAGARAALDRMLGQIAPRPSGTVATFADIDQVDAALENAVRQVRA